MSYPSKERLEKIGRALREGRVPGRKGICFMKKRGDPGREVLSNPKEIKTDICQFRGSKQASY